MKILALIVVIACSHCYYYMGSRHHIPKKIEKRMEYIKKRQANRVHRYEDNRFVRYYFGNFRNAYDGRSKCRK